MIQVVPYFRFSRCKAANIMGTSADNVGETTSDCSPGPDVWSIIVVDTALTLLGGSILLLGTLWFLNRQSKRREERDKLLTIIRANYWNNEDEILSALCILQKMSHTAMFRGVTEYDVFAYKYRLECDLSPPPVHQASGSGPSLPFDVTTPNAVVDSVKKLDRLFEALALQLSFHGRCPSVFVNTIGSTICHLAQHSSRVWGTKKAQIIRDLLQYYSGKEAAKKFESLLVSDDNLEVLVLTHLPYAKQLRLHDCHFILDYNQVTVDFDSDLRSKICYIDIVLANTKDGTKPKEGCLVDAYNTAREICIKNKLVYEKYLPEAIHTTGTGDSKGANAKSQTEDEAAKSENRQRVDDCVRYLCHLLRVMFFAANLKELESEDQFHEFVTKLYEAVHVNGSGAAREMAESSRRNIIRLVRALSSKQMTTDAYELTRSRLEAIEKELLDLLTCVVTSNQGKTRHSRVMALQKADSSASLRTALSQSSIYTLATSASAFALNRQPAFDCRRYCDLELLQQQSVDRSSIISGSSVYFSPPSMSSGCDGSRPVLSALVAGRRIQSSVSLDEFCETAV